MKNGTLDCRYLYNSALHTTPPAGVTGEWIDLARDPSSAHLLIKLGVSPRSDLPAVILSEPGGKIRLLGLRIRPDEAARVAAGEALPQGSLVVYSASWCPDCRRAKLLLDDAGVAYDEVNVDQSVEAEALVLARSGGRRVIPTLLFDDRIWTFNPAPGLLKRMLAGGGATTAGAADAAE